jgi:putative glycosyltransferase
MQKISIVTSLYKSSDYVFEFYQRHLACLKEMKVDYEFIFVDDGSPDDSSDKVKELIQNDTKIKLIIFSRNFGQYPAMFAGLAYAEGDLIYTSDSDLEEPPENIKLLYNKLILDQNIDFLYGVTSNRSGGIVKSFLGGIFYRIIRWSSDLDIPKNISWQILMTKNYKNALLLHKEAETLPAGLMVITGFNQDYILIDKTYKGSTSYTFKKRLRLAFNSITAFSSKPLVVIGILGIFITLISFIGILTFVILKLFFINFQSGWISVILSIWLVGGLILSSLGIIGIYLAKVFNQIKNRPLYIIKSIISNKTNQK